MPLKYQSTRCMKDKLIDIVELLDLLGFDDLRSVKKFCESNRLPLLKIGKRTYTISNYLDMYISHELRLFTAANYSNPEEVINAVMNNDTNELKRAVLAQTGTGNIKEKNRNTEERSDAAKAFLKNIE